MYSKNQKLINRRSGLTATIDLVVENKRGTLYTVKYDESGEFRRYYTPRLEKFFTILDQQGSEVQPDDSNVTFVNFKTREKFADRTAWMYYNNMAS